MQTYANCVYQPQAEILRTTTSAAVGTHAPCEHVAANRELIARMEKKIQATLARVWGEKGLHQVAKSPNRTSSTPQSLWGRRAARQRSG